LNQRYPLMIQVARSRWRPETSKAINYHFIQSLCIVFTCFRACL